MVISSHGRFVTAFLWLGLILHSRPTVVPRASVVCCPSLLPSINSAFSEAAAWIQTKLYGKLPIHHISRPFLALLDYISRAHEIKNLSVVCVAIFSDPTEQISFYFQFFLPLGHMQ